MKRVCFVEELRENLIFPRSDFNEMSQYRLLPSTMWVSTVESVSLQFKTIPILTCKNKSDPSLHCRQCIAKVGICHLVFVDISAGDYLKKNVKVCKTYIY